MPISEAGYSGTPLATKLGLKPGRIAWMIGAPAEIAAALDVPTAAEIETLPDALDIVHLFTDSRVELAAALPRLRERIFPDGAIWVSWPKRTSKVPTDITEDAIRAEALPIGLVDVKVCAVDEIWSGLKLVVPVKLRTVG